MDEAFRDGGLFEMARCAAPLHVEWRRPRVNRRRCARPARTETSSTRFASLNQPHNLTTPNLLNLYLDYYLRRCYIDSQPRSSKGVLRRHPEDGARRGVLRQRLITAAPGGTGPRQPGTTTRTRGARCNRSGANAGEGSAGPEPPGGGRPASWDARRLARRLACRVKCRPTGASQAPDDSRRSATPRSGGREATKQNPGAENAPRERDLLFEMVKPRTRSALLRRHSVWYEPKT